ncbi:uncharacterized protein LOC128269140 [Anopheles cruzii]|uniref:uncharacterized protein LOC128269140 n=1 Tax=Anopheles cruzii TaxID=68878 RepID=UPI0022EC8934|nr:uncharacterized protein LOC128269140 [Anopheles cruzii]
MTSVNQIGLAEEDLRKIIEEHLTFAGIKSEKSFDVVYVTLEPFSACPDGFLADHYSLKVKFQTSGDPTEELNFFVKCLPINNPQLALYLDEIGSFRKETSVLQDILRPLQEYCPWRKIAPRVHFARANKLLVMQNLKNDGYGVIKGESGLLDNCSLREALQTLACLHASSIVLEEKRGKSLVELFPTILKENAWINSTTSTRTKDVDNVIKLYINLVKLEKRWPAERKEAIITQLPTLIRTIYQYVVPCKRFRNCLNHGDLWCNNLMFKTNAQGDSTDCVLVDFQMSRYVPIGYDINLLLYLTTSAVFRKNHEKTLLAFYYSCFAKVLELNSVDVHKIYSLSDFLECCQHYKLAGLIHSVMISGEVTLPQEFLEQVFKHSELTAGFMPEPKISICVKAFQADQTYKAHLLELMEELFTHIK